MRGRAKAATLLVLTAAGALGTGYQFWAWYTGALGGLEFFWPAPAALVAAFWLDVRWGYPEWGDGDEA